MTRSVDAGLSNLSPEIMRWAQNANYTSLACRDVRHAWPADMASLRWREEIYNSRRVWVREAACMHKCGVSRIQRRYQDTLELFTRYAYPTTEEGEPLYLLPSGCGALNANDIFALQLKLAEAITIPEQQKRKTRRGRKR